MDKQPPGELVANTCPLCGGPLWRRDHTQGANGDGAAEYECRIGHTLTPAQLWIEHAAMRNRAVAAAARAIAEHVDLARAMAREARAIGGDGLAARLDEEARSEERHLGQLLAMLGELAEDETGDGTGR